MLLYVILFVFFPLYAKMGEPDSSRTDSTKQAPLQNMKRIGILTREESQFYRSDLFPLSLAQRGRLSATAYRGMPPGFREYQFAGNDLRNPSTSFWNEQWLPYYVVDQTKEFPGSGRQFLESAAPVSSQPLTRIIFSQDYVVNLSFLDINFLQRISPTNFIHLSGSNFLSDGSQPSDFSKIMVTTYRGRVHLRLSPAWQTDLYYWQIRHRFNMLPSPGEFLRDKFKLVTHLIWARVYGKISPRDSLVIIPGYKTMEDRYTRGNDTRRDNRYKIAHLSVDYSHHFSAFRVGARVQSAWIGSKSRRFWIKHREGDGRVLGYVERSTNGLRLLIEGGVYRHSESGQQAVGSVEVDAPITGAMSIGVSAFSRAAAPPILWRTLTYDSIPSYTAKPLIEKQGIAGNITLSPATWFRLQMEPFVYYTRNYPLWSAENSRWKRQTFRNRGIRVISGLDLRYLYIENDLTFSPDYKTVYAPQLNNITTIKTSLRLFNALQLDGIFTWHYVGYYQVIDFQRFLLQYRLSDAETGPIYLADLRLQAYFNQAVVFFVWENLLSQDYSIVSDTLENLLIFRLGINWILFD